MKSRASGEDSRQRTAPIVKIRASGDDAREIAHDFSNLLTAIIGATDAVLERSGLDPETRDDIAHIREGARRGTALVQRLRTGAKDAPAPFGLIPVNETIRATSRLLAHRLGANIKLTLDLKEHAGLAQMEPWQLDRLLLNLIANARHAMPNGGAVTLGSERRVVVAVEARVPDTIPTGDYVVVAVADSGRGIARDQLARIFDSGFSSRRRAGGTGLGLSSVRDIMRQIGGFLAVESREGQGTRFEIYLPRQDGELPSRTAQARPTASGRTVLLVEDDMFVRKVAERVLSRAGWTVFCADSGEAALEILEVTACDLMISDVAMPGMDGTALARHVRERLPALPIILTSGYERTRAEDGDGTRNFAFLTKPYDHEELLAAVARVVGEQVAGHSSIG